MKKRLDVKSKEMAKTFIPLLESKFDSLMFDIEVEDKSFYINISSQDGQAIPGNDIDAEINAISNALGPLSKRLSEKVIDSYTSTMSLSDPLEVSKIAQNTTSDNLGSYVISEQGENIIQTLDLCFSSIAKKFNAKEWSIPVVLTESYLQKCGVLPKDELQVHRIDGTKNLILSPAVCLGCYSSFLNNISSNFNAITGVGKVFRRESGRFNSLIRIREYRCREIIFCSEYLQYFETRLQLLKYTTELLKRLDISFRVAFATDMFFDQSYLKIASSQLLNEAKTEILYVFKDGEYSLGSINFHDKNFLSAFSNGTPKSMITFCIAFGLERWLYAIASRYSNLNLAEKIIQDYINELL